MENFEKLTVLPETLTVVDLPQLSFDELDKVDYKTLNNKTTDELKQIAQSASNASDVLMNTETTKLYPLTFDEKILRGSSKAMLDLFANGSYDINAQNAGSIVFAQKVLADIAKPGTPLEISYDNYQHLTRAVSTTFRGNARVAQTINNIFLVYNSVAVEIVSANERLKHYELLYKAGSDIVNERILIEKANENGIEVQEAGESTTSVVDLVEEGK